MRRPSRAHRHERVRDERDGRGGEEHQPERQQDDRAQVGFEFAKRGEVPAREQQRRQEPEEDQVGRQLDGGHLRDEREHQPTEHHHDRRRERQTARHAGQDDDDAEEQDDEADVAHTRAA